jgi:plasmid stability protein
VATLTVRNIPDDAKHRFRQVAAAHGRSMEEHLRQLVIEAGADEPAADRVREARQDFKAAPTATPTREDRVKELLRLADGAGEGAVEAGRYAEIRFMTAKDAIAELRRLANGAELDVPPALSTRLEAPEF